MEPVETLKEIFQEILWQVKIQIVRITSIDNLQSI